MKNKYFLFFLAICVSIYFVGCTAFEARGLQMGLNTNGTENLGDFTLKVKVNEFLGLSGGYNLFNISANKTSKPIQDAIEKEIQNRGGVGATNIVVKNSVSFGQMLLNVLTATIWAPSTVTISGTIVGQK
jgi:hypothetical protein